jgi:hypothetical protein
VIFAQADALVEEGERHRDAWVAAIRRLPALRAEIVAIESGAARRRETVEILSGIEIPAGQAPPPGLIAPAAALAALEAGDHEPASRWLRGLVAASDAAGTPEGWDGVYARAGNPRRTLFLPVKGMDV